MIAMNLAGIYVKDYIVNLAEQLPGKFSSQ